MQPLSEPICNRVINSLDGEVIVIDRAGQVVFVNDRAIETLGAVPDKNRISDFFEGGQGGERLRRIAQTSIWAPVNFTLKSGPMRGMELKFRGCGFREKGAQESQVLLVADRHRDQGFTQLRKLIRDLNRDLAERQQTANRLQGALVSEERMHTELIHRVKNNLSLLSALISTRRNTSQSEEARTALQDLEHRVQAIASVHEILDRAGAIEMVPVADLIRSLCHYLESSIMPPNVQIENDLAEIALHVDDATPLSLMVNELITNALKHAFPDDKPGRVHIKLLRNGHDKLEVGVRDNGKGMNAARDGAGSGSRIVRALAGQMRGELSHESDGDGTSWTFVFPTSATDRGT